MSSFVVLVVVAAMQIVFILLTVILLLTTRLRGSRDRVRDTNAHAFLAPSLRSIMLGDDRGEALAAALSRLDPDIATREMIEICGARLSEEQRQSVARLVRHSPWVERTLRGGRSRQWWRRMEAARLLAMVCDEGDEDLLASFVTDRHPAVASAATGAIARCASAPLVRAVVAGLPARPSSVRQQQANALRSHADLATTAVTEFLSRPAPAGDLRAWAQLVEVLATPQALAAVVPLAVHEDVEVRTSVARALRSYFSPDAVEAVTRLLGDEDWRVRAAAARALGALNVVTAIPLLSASMRDESWWVRFRAALALADMSDEGRAALGEVRQSADPYARDMATLVCGLSSGSRLELTSA